MTPEYCSPEQASRRLLSKATDLWSWGLSVLEMFAGGPFWMSVPGATVGQLAADALAHLDSGAPAMALKAVEDAQAPLGTDWRSLA